MLSAAAVSITLLGVSLFIFHHIHNVQNGPYMDEIFHIRQAREYCAKNFSNWDPMITTLPGLYLSSLVMLSPFYVVNGDFLPVCSTYSLRAGNLIYCCGNFVLLFLSSKLIYMKSQSRKGPTYHLMLNAITISLFPVLYFFTWLYYTDPGSIFFTLLMYYMCLRHNHGLAALSGVVSILFRQTNVIWVLFCLAMTAADVIEKRLKLGKKSKHIKTYTDWQVFKSILNVVFSGRQNFLSILKEIIINGAYYFLVMTCFSVFVYVNNGLVVGDRSNHQASLNFPQVFYFLAVSAAFAFIHFIHPRQILTCIRSLYRNPLKVAFFAVFAFFLIKHFTYEHKYTLSDNRHYTFYFWSKWFKRFSWARYVMISVYLYSLVNYYHLTIHKGFLWRLSLSVCVVLCLVPQALLEFRYFIMPYFILRLNMNLPSVKALFAELAFYIAINAFTIYMFIQKPFYWPNDPSPQRFMW